MVALLAHLTTITLSDSLDVYKWKEGVGALKDDFKIYVRKHMATNISEVHWHKEVCFRPYSKNMRLFCGWLVLIDCQQDQN